MSLRTPEWFAPLDRWWLPAVGQDLARNVTPLGLDGQDRLHLTCSTRVWQIQTRLLEQPLTTRVNRCTPQTVAGIVAHVAGQR
ncbi:DciA family protein [Kitasatospora aureofaciens]|uniref:DciA family protein n=1 Tax=Kitasatospora aureofaciens TaxID=1894 RepID=UPI0033BE1CCF